VAQKKRQQPDSAAETLDAIEGFGDRIVHAVTENPTPILATAVGILVVAAVFGLTRDFSDSGASESAAALARVQAQYRTAMGGNPGSLEVPEPANPETAERLRAEAITGYEEVAAEHAETRSAAIALLEAGKLQQQLDENAEAIASFERGLEQIAADDPIRAFLLARLASVHEAEGQWSEAAAAFEQAAGVAGYALRYDALADAARTWAQAGDRERAVAAYERIRSEAPAYQLAPYVEARLSELDVAANGS